MYHCKQCVEFVLLYIWSFHILIGCAAVHEGPTKGVLCEMLHQQDSTYSCAPQQCRRDKHFRNQQHPTSNKVVLSYAHNGFGNQLWSHAFAWQTAESLNAQLYIAALPHHLSKDGKLPPNSDTGQDAMTMMFSRDFFLYDRTTEDQTQSLKDQAAALCEQEEFYFSDRPVEMKNDKYSTTRNEKLISLLNDPNPRCLKLLGYFQLNFGPPCIEQLRGMWIQKLTSFLPVNFPIQPTNICVYLRCLPRHYHFNSVKYYHKILTGLHSGNTSEDHSRKQIWLFEAPQCDSRNKDMRVHHVLKYFVSHHLAHRWKRFAKGENFTSYPLLQDMAGLMACNRIITGESTWAEWASWLSDATEIHANSPPISHLFQNMNLQLNAMKKNTYLDTMENRQLRPLRERLIFHNQAMNQYFGQYQNNTRIIQYEFDA